MSSSGLRHYSRDEFLDEFYPDPGDKAAIAAGMEQLRAEQRAFRLERRRCAAASASPRPRSLPGWALPRAACPPSSTLSPRRATELRTLAAYVEALGGRLEIIADFGDQRLAFTEPGTEAA